MLIEIIPKLNKAIDHIQDLDGQGELSKAVDLIAEVINEIVEAAEAVNRAAGDLLQVTETD